LISFSDNEILFESYIEDILSLHFHDGKIIKRIDTLFNMIYDDLKWDIVMEPNITKIYKNNLSKGTSIKLTRILSLKNEIEFLKNWIVNRNRNIEEDYHLVILFNIYSLFTNAFLISLPIIFIHLVYGLLVNPFLWLFSSHEKRVLPSTFLKLWSLNLFIFIIMVVSMYFWVRDKFKVNIYELLEREIYDRTINFYGSFNKLYITFNLVLWLILNRENFLILICAPFVRWPSYNDKRFTKKPYDDDSYDNVDISIDKQNSSIDNDKTHINSNTSASDLLDSDKINENGSYNNDNDNEVSIIDSNNGNINDNYSDNFIDHDNDISSFEKDLVGCSPTIKRNSTLINDEDTLSEISNVISQKLSYKSYDSENYFKTKHIPSNTKEYKRIIKMYQNIIHGFLIVCHNSSDVLPKTLKCLLQITTPMSIFIAENGSTPEEKQKMKDIVDQQSRDYRATHPDYTGLNIIYANLNEGSKTLAQFCLLNNLHWYGINIKYVSVLDDDVLIPKNWVEDEILSYFNDPKVKALAYPIRASNCREGIIPAFQNLEYIFSMYNKKFHRDVGTVIFPSGAMGTWSVPYLLECLYLHDTVFRGDDLQLGIRLHTMYGKPKFCNPNELHDGNYKIEIAHVTVDTLVPDCYFHLHEYLPNFLGKYLKPCSCGQYSLSRQRIVYWEPARHRFISKFSNCVTHKCKWNHRATLTAKFFCIDFIITVVNDYLFVALLIFLFIKKSYLQVLMIICICFAMAYISLDIFNIVIAKNKPEIKLPYEVCVIYPVFYQFFSTLFYRFGTIIYTITYYLPFVRNNIKINKRAMNKDIGYMSMTELIPDDESEKAIANVTDISDFITTKKQLKEKKFNLFKGRGKNNVSKDKEIDEEDNINDNNNSSSTFLV